MIRIIALLVVFSAVAAAQTGPAAATFTFLGQSTFVMTTSTGLKVLIDPQTMFKNAPVDGVDVVTISHEHPDHNDPKLATGSPTVIRGLAGDDFAKIDQTAKGVRIRTVASFHDLKQGAERGKNAIFIFELPGMKVVHLGDLGHSLNAQQVAAIGPADVLLIPVSGGPTIDPKTAIEVADQLSAKAVIPMHYGTGAPMGRGPGGPGAAPGGRGPGEPGARGAGAPPRGFSLGTLDDFLKVLPAGTAVVQAGHTTTITAGQLPAARTVMVMRTE
jgi:L-ascorbate metabolism protein UlaG (beta-lactamase superfamily)